MQAEPRHSIAIAAAIMQAAVMQATTWSSQVRADEAKQFAYGRHLAQECSTCHRVDGTDNGIPSITGWQSDHFVTTMDYYRNGARINQVMLSVVQSLDDNQIKALAAYYGSLPRPPKKK